LAYGEDMAGGLMNPRYLRVRPDMTVEEALSYLRKHMQDRASSGYYAYVLNAEQQLLGVVSFRELFTAPPGSGVHDVMQKDVITIPEDMKQEDVSHRLARTHLVALPVIDTQRRMKGLVTADDVVDVVQEEATEDMQKVGGAAALDAPYLRLATPRMIQKRVGWLSALFLGEMLTASAMSY